MALAFQLHTSMAATALPKVIRVRYLDHLNVGQDLETCLITPMLQALFKTVTLCIVGPHT